MMSDSANRWVGKIWKYGDNVDTDVIFPGRYTYTARSPEEIAAHALEDLDPDFASKARPGDIVIGGRNWGCGSSREQAVTCLKHSGAKAVVAVSFGRIFYRNAINQGLWALTASASSIESLRHGERAEIDLAAGLITAGERQAQLVIPDERLRRIIADGGLIPHISKTLKRSSAEPTAT